MNNSYAVAAFGIPEFEQELVERIFSLSESRDKVYRLVKSDEVHLADIALLDRSNPGALSRFEEFSSTQNDVPTVNIASGECAEDEYFVRRPFTAMRMLGVLDEVVSNELSSARASRRRAPAKESSAAGSDNTAPAPAGTEIYNALVVDDSLPVRKQVGIALRRAGITADFAETGEAALDLLGSNKYDIVFLDVVLPGADGYEICKSIKRDKAKKSIPVVMLTGRSSPFDKVKGRLSGCDSYLTKPVSLKEFNQTLEKWLNPPLTFESMANAK